MVRDTAQLAGEAPDDAPSPAAATTAPRSTPAASSGSGTSLTTTRTASAPVPPKKAGPVAKKAAQASVDTLVVKEGEEGWTQAELDEVLAELGEQRAHSLEVLSALEVELNGLMRDSGDGAGQDQADMGATSFERDHELTVLNSERDKLAQIERALTHIDEGTYGVCESCGGPIGKMRLMAFPRATLCMTCKQREERR